MFETILNKAIDEKKQKGFKVTIESGIYRIQDFNKDFTLIDSINVIKKISVLGTLAAVTDLSKSFIKIFSAGRQIADLKDSMFLINQATTLFEAQNIYPLIVENSINITYDSTLTDFIFNNVYLAYCEYIRVIFKK